MLLTAFLIFVCTASLLALLGSRLWSTPRAALERVAGNRAEPVRMAPHPSLAWSEVVKKIGNLVPAAPREVTAMRRRLIRAGFRGPGALRTLYGSKIILCLALPLCASAVVLHRGAAGSNRYAYLLVAAVAGFLGPNEYIRFAARRRRKSIRRGLPNALDLMVVCVESGLGLDQATVQVAKELQSAHPEISEEFGLMNLELKAGKRKADALRNMADRAGVDELRKLTAVIIQAERFGTSIAQTLRGHSDYMRVQSRQLAEEKAAKVGVKLVFPIFFCILPSLFVVTVGPVIVRIMRELIPMMTNM